MLLPISTSPSASMISNGFQARLLHRDFTSIEETFALTPAASLISPSIPPTPAGPDDLEESSRSARFPGIYLGDYSSALQAKVLKAVRRGAVFVEPYSNSRTVTAAVDGDEAARTTDKSEKVDAASSAEVGCAVKSTKLLLAFRWIGSEHDNAESAKILDDISEASLPSISGVGLTPASDSPVNLPAPSALSPSSAPLPPVELTAQKESKTSLLDLAANLFKRKKTRRSIALAAKMSASSTDEQPAKNRSFLVQLYIDNVLVPLAYTSEQKAKHKDTLAFTVGALLDLGIIGKDKPDAPAKEILQTVTLHLWDASRSDVKSKLDGRNLSTEWDIKKTVAPEVVFHFEIVSSGPTEAALTSEALHIPAHPSEKKGVLVEELQTTEEEVADAEVELKSALYSGARLGTLPPVEEEARVTSTDEETGKGKTSSTPIHKFIDTFIEASRVKFSPYLYPKKEPGTDKEGKPGLKTIARRMSLHMDRTLLEAKKQERRERRASMPSLSSHGRAAWHTQLRPMALIGKPRFFSNQRDSESGDSAGPAQGSLGELTAAIQRSYRLQQELSRVERERRQLEQQWNHRLLLSFHERVSTLEKRLEDGKQEVKKLRKRAFLGPAPITSTLPPSPPTLPPTLPPKAEVAAED